MDVAIVDVAIEEAPHSAVRPRLDKIDLVARALPVGLALAARLAVGPLPIDDAYITFRYARNLAEGLGFAYNPGERVLGTTTPLWTLLLASLHGLTGLDLPWLSLVLSALLDAGTALLLIHLAGRLGLGHGWAVLVATLFALNPPSIAYATGGMESSLFTFLVVGAVSAGAMGRPGLAGLAAGFATLARPEGLLVGGLIAGRHLVVGQAPPRRVVLAYLATVLPWLAFATWWFGSPVPQTIAAKAVAYRAPLEMNAERLLVQLGEPGLSLLTFQVVPSSVGMALGAAVLLSPLLCWRAMVRYLRARPEVWPLATFAPLLAGAYALAGLRSVWLFDWYLVPLVPFYLLGGVAMVRLSTLRAPATVAALAGVALLAWMMLGLSLGREPGRHPLAPLGVNLAREDAYTAAGRYLAPRLGPDTVVALPEFGVFGYVTGARILDTVGLVSPRATRYYPLPSDLAEHNAVPPELIREERPDFLVGLERFLPEQLVGAEWFRRGYRPVASFEAPLWSSRMVVIYERVGTGREPPDE